MKGFEQRRIQHRIGEAVHRVQASVDWSHKGQKRSTSSFLRFWPVCGFGILQLGGGLSACRAQRYESDGYVCISPEEELGLIFFTELLFRLSLLFLLYCFSFVSASPPLSTERIGQHKKYRKVVDDLPNRRDQWINYISIVNSQFYWPYSVIRLYWIIRHLYS